MTCWLLHYSFIYSFSHSFLRSVVDSRSLIHPDNEDTDTAARKRMSKFDSEKLQPEDEMFARAARITNCTELNLKKTDEFVINNRGQVLHVRSSWPPAGQPVKAMAVFVHGECNQSSAPFRLRLLCLHARSKPSPLTMSCNSLSEPILSP